MKDAQGHGSNGRGGKRLAKPIPGHPYHSKSDAELRFIAKDAAEARDAMRGHSPDAENKYADQVNDAASVLGYRDRGGQQDRAAADALHSGGAKSDAAPTHDSMSIRSHPSYIDMNTPEGQTKMVAARARDAASSRAEADRDFALRARNGQIGSGMKFRG